MKTIGDKLTHFAVTCKTNPIKKRIEKEQA